MIYPDCDVSISKLFGFETFLFLMMLSDSVQEKFGIKKVPDSVSSKFGMSKKSWILGLLMHWIYQSLLAAPFNFNLSQDATFVCVVSEIHVS